MQIMAKKPKSEVANDAFIAFEGIGIISSCLKWSLELLVQTTGNNASVSPLIGSKRPIDEKPTVASLDFNQTDCIFSVFGEAVLATQRVDSGNDLHATFQGVSEHYNRIGQNWRVVAENEFVLQQVLSSQTTGRLEGEETERFSAYSRKAQILACGDG